MKLKENNGILRVKMPDDPKETRGIEGGRLSRKKAVKSPSFREYRLHSSLVYVLFGIVVINTFLLDKIYNFSPQQNVKFLLRLEYQAILF